MQRSTRAPRESPASNALLINRPRPETKKVIGSSSDGIPGMGRIYAALHPDAGRRAPASRFGVLRSPVTWSHPRDRTSGIGAHTRLQEVGRQVIDLRASAHRSRNAALVLALCAITSLIPASAHHVPPTALRLPDVPRWAAVRTPELEVSSAGTVTVQDVTVTISKVIYKSGRRSKRLFVGVPPNPSAAVVVALNASQGEGDGAGDLIWPDPAHEPFQYRWPVVAAARYGTPFIAIDSPTFGAFEYTPSSAQEVVTDDILGVKAGLAVLADLGSGSCSHLFAGGLSWGATRAMQLAAAVPEVSHVYAASPQLQASWWPGSIFDPPEWSGVWDYPNLLAALDAEVRLTYGEPSSGEYMWQPNAQPILDYLSAQPHIDVHQFDGGHRVDFNHLLSFVGTFTRSARAN